MRPSRRFQHCAVAGADSSERGDRNEQRKQNFGAQAILGVETQTGSLYIVAYNGEYGMGDDRESVRRKKLLFRARHRGTREAGLLLGNFAERYLGDFDAERLDRFEALLDLEDAVIYDWVAGLAEPPEQERSDVVQMFLAFRFHG
jgi:antitoxin CptB